MDRKRALVVIVGAIAAVVLGASPAFAHDALVTGTVTCTPAGDQLVTWYNQQGPPGWGPSVISASNRASVAVGQSVPGTTPVQVGTETFPGTATGTLTLAVSWHWADTANDSSSGQVTLGIDCTHPTPPPTSPPPTSPPPTSPPPTSPPPTSPPPTSPPPTSSSSTSTPPPSSSSSSTPPSGTSSSTTTGPPSATSGSTTPGTAFTGMSSAPLIGLGAFLILGDRRARHQPPEGGRGLSLTGR